MRFLVTGGAGFIGSNLVDSLIKVGHHVRIIDNLITGKKENINPNAAFVQADIRDINKIKPHFEDIDGVFHAAALPRVQPSIINPQETHDINVNGTLNVFLAARDIGVKRVVYSSSSSVYGPQDTPLLNEKMVPNPISPYSVQKLFGEQYAKLFSTLYNLETVSLRYFNVYGPRMIENGAYATSIKIFLGQRNANRPLTIRGDGKQTRDFTHIDDVVRANILAMQSSETKKGEIVNIGSGKSYSVNKIAELIGGEITYVPPVIEPRDTLADITLAKDVLNWRPTKNLEEELKGI